MTDRTQIPDTELAVDKPVTFQVMREMRDNTTISSWEPYDGIDGVIWDQDVDGSVTTVSTPQFVDGYEYQLIWNMGRDNSSGTTLDFSIRSIFPSYTSNYITVSTALRTRSGYLEVLRPRLSRNVFQVAWFGRGTGTTLNSTLAGDSGVINYALTTDDVMDSIDIKVSANTQHGKVWLYRRTANDGNTVT